MTARTAARLVFAMMWIGAACGGSNNATTDGNAHHDSPPRPIDAPGLYDFGCGGNTACTLDKVCCAMPGATTQFGCVAIASCPAADKIACDGPDECGGPTPVCCGVDAPDGTGTYPQCNPASIGTSCTSAAQCTTHLATSCSDTTMVQICHMSSECTDATNNQCCTFTSGGAMLTFCIDSLTASLAGATCH